MPISSQTADQTLLGMTPQTTTESSKSIKSTWDEELKARSVFSARTTSQKYIEMVKKHLADVASRGMTPQQAELKLKKALEDLGYSPESGFKDGGVPPAKPGEMRDLSSSRRIQLILDTNVKQAISLGQMAASEDPMLLMMHPAWELRRMGARKKPRGDWKKRWKAAGDKCGWKGALKKQMIALKTSPIWQALADGAGGFQDTLGSPYPPFAFGSGLAWASVGRKQWIKLCDNEGVNDGLDEITQKAKELKNKPKVAQPTAPTFEGVDRSFERAKTIAQPIKTAPISGLFKADFKARLKADDVIDQALADINKLRVEAGKISTEMAELREEAGKIAGPKPIGERRKLQDLITTKRSAVRDASVELDALWGRVVGYGKAVGTTPVPTDESAQKRFNEAMARYSKAAEKTVRLCKSQLGRIEILAAAARKTMEKLRELKVEFKPDLSKKQSLLKIIADSEEYVERKKPLRQKWFDAIIAKEQEISGKKAEWPSANYIEVNSLLMEARTDVSKLSLALSSFGDSIRMIKSVAESIPEPTDENSQIRFNASMDEKIAKVESSKQLIESDFDLFNITEVLKSADEAYDRAVEAEKKRICDDIFKKAEKRANDVVGNQVADILAEKKIVDKDAKAKGVLMDGNNPIAKAWERAYNAARSARSNVRKLLGELKKACDDLKVEAAKQAEVKFGLGIDYCLKKYGVLDNAFEDWKDELKRVRSASSRSDEEDEGGVENAPKGALRHDPMAFPKELTASDVANARGGIGGSTGAKLYTDSLGRKFILKQTNATKPGDGKITREHLENEAATDNIYRAAGIKVPDCKVFDVDGKPVKLATFIPDAKPLGDWMASASSEQKKELRKKLAKGFLLDAVLANWDVAGASLDNILVDASGEPWRIDNGSGMGFRARGVEKKPDEWENSKFPDEWRTLRSQNSSVFGGLSAHDIFSQEVDWDAVIKATPVKDRPIVERRAKEMKEMQIRCKNFDIGKFAPEATSDILEKSYDACKDGLRETIPTEKIEYEKYGNFRPVADLSFTYWDEYQYSDILITAAKNINYHLNGDKKPNKQKVDAALSIKSKLEELAKKDPNAKALLKTVKEIEDSAASSFSIAISQVSKLALQKPKDVQVNTKPSVTETVIDFVEKTTGNYDFIKRWCDSQSGSSWDIDACKAKIFEFELRGKNPDPTTGIMELNGRLVGKNGELYGFKKRDDESRIKNYKKAWEYYKAHPDEMERDRQAFRAYKASVQVVLENTKCEYIDYDTGTIILCRTEQEKVMEMDGMKKGEFGRMTRSGAESHSIFRTVNIGGADQLTIVRVPFPRVSGMYFMDRDKNGESLFLGDGENEFNVDINNGELPVYYYGTVRPGRDTKPFIKEFLEAEKKANFYPAP